MKRRGCIFGVVQWLWVGGVVAAAMLILLGGALQQETGFRRGEGASANRRGAAQIAALGPAVYRTSQPFATQLPTIPPASALTPTRQSPAIPPAATPTPIRQSSTVNRQSLTPAPPLPSPSVPPPTDTPTPLPKTMRLVIPALNLDAAIIPAPVEGESWQVNHLGQAVGHLEGTAFPGDADNAVLAGHVTLLPDGRAGPFFRLHTLSPGDTMIVYRDDRAYAYRVASLFTVKPTNIEVTYPSTRATLTLITCLNYDRAAGRYTDRLVVVGRQIDD